jgi:hypothetical protein
MEPSTWLLVAWVVLVFGTGPFFWLFLVVFPIVALLGLLAGSRIMNEKRLLSDDKAYHDSLLSNSEKCVRDSLDAETLHTEDH